MPPRSRTALQEQRREFTRQRLLEGAWIAFCAKGYVATTADDIASAAGCSRATFYLYFKSKSAVMIELLERQWDGVIEAGRAFDAELEAGGTWDTVRAAVAEMFQSLNSRRGALAATYEATLCDVDVAEWLEYHRTKHVDSLAWTLSRAGHAERARLRDRLILLSRMTMAALHVDRWPNSEISDETVIDYLADLWAEALHVDRWPPRDG